MFGKKSSMSANERFVTNMGKKAGNLSRPLKAKMEPGQGTKGSTLPSADAMKLGIKVNQNKPQSLGKSNTFNTTKRVPR